MENTPEFYTGAPVDPVDLRYRGAFLKELWRALRARHVVLTAPRRTGKTSVMDHLRDNPENGVSVVSINAQDLTHPADFFQGLLDALHDAHPDFVRDQLATGWELVGNVLGKIDEIGVGGFKLALRQSDPGWRENWRQHGDTFLTQARKTRVPIVFIVDELPDMLSGRGVRFETDVVQRLIARLGRPIPLFMQMATQDLYRLWKNEQRKIVATDVDTLFDALIVSSGARTRLQHFYSRIRQYYAEPKRSIAYALLSQISVSESGLGRVALMQETDRLLLERGLEFPRHERKQMFNQLLLDLDNDFYIIEVEDEFYDFASGVLKLWWRKYYA